MAHSGKSREVDVEFFGTATMRTVVLFLVFLPLVVAPVGHVSVYGFDDFCYEEICYDNPSAELALELDGLVVPVERTAIEGLELAGASLGIGLDPTAEGAYINGSAYGLASLATGGPDAGDFACGWLYARMLQEDACSVFVHVPSGPDDSDRELLQEALRLIRVCKEVHHDS